MRSSSVLASLVLVLVLTLLSTMIHLKPCRAARTLTQHLPATDHTQFIKSSCSVTLFPALCYSSLSAYASTIKSSPTQMAHLALSLSLDSTRNASTAMKAMSARFGPSMRGRVAGAMSDCLDTVGDSVAELKQSMDGMKHLGGPSLGFQLDSIQTWVSAALTNDDTCMDEFEGRAMNGEVKNAVRSRMVSVTQLTSNALALINSLASAAHSSTP